MTKYPSPSELWLTSHVRACLAAEPDLAVGAEFRATVDKNWDTWTASSSRPPFDGEAVMALTLVQTGENETVIECARGRYRDALAAMAGLVPWSALAVTGMTFATFADGPRVLIGRRAEQGSKYHGAYEMPPSGTVEWADIGPKREVDILARYVAEFREEICLPGAGLSRCRPLGVIRTTGLIDVIVGAMISGAIGLYDDNLCNTKEYDDLRFVRLGNVTKYLRDKTIVPTLELILVRFEELVYKGVKELFNE